PAMRAFTGFALVLAGIFSSSWQGSSPESNDGPSWNLVPMFGAMASSTPEMTATYFKNTPAKLYYFDDTTSVLYLDSMEGNVWLSEDEGKIWRLINDVPRGEAVQLIEHPFDNRMKRNITGLKIEDELGEVSRCHYHLRILPTLWPSTRIQADRAIYYIKASSAKGIQYSDQENATYYTKDAFSDEPKLLVSQSSKCLFAHSSKDFLHNEHKDLIFCLAFETTADEAPSPESARLIASNDFFSEDRRIIDFGVGTRLSRGAIAMGVVSKFLVVALRDLSEGNNGEMVLYVTIDAKNWAKAHFPHSSNSKLHENSYTIVESTTHSLAIDVQSHASRNIGTLFVSNSNGTFFVESMRNTHRSDSGYVDFENLVNIEGVGMANYIDNAEEIDRGSSARLKLKSKITYDDGSSWDFIQAPSRDMHDKPFSCDTTKVAKCSLHLHSVSNPHNIGRVFSSTAPGFVMGVGTVSEFLDEYEESDTYLSTDGGRNWKQVRHGAHKYEFGDQGNIMVIINDEKAVDHFRYSIDSDSTSQKFLLLGALDRKDQTDSGKFVVVHLDFAGMRSRQCGDGDLEKWYARGKSGHECIMGHKDPESHSENCACTDADYEWTASVNLLAQSPSQLGPALVMDQIKHIWDPRDIASYLETPVTKKVAFVKTTQYPKIVTKVCISHLHTVHCESLTPLEAEPPEGEVVHQTTVLVQLYDGSIWQSSNEGYTWKQLYPEEKLLTFYMHTYSDDRAYLFTGTKTYYYTTDGGRSWNIQEAPLPPNLQ
ncbi:7423_t:CDS:2, partial [Acaulospora colombiana]